MESCKIYDFVNFEGSRIIGIQGDDENKFYFSFSNKTQELAPKSISFRWSCRPERENDSVITLLFRDLEILKSTESDSRACTSFKFFEKTEKESKITLIKFGYNPEGQDNYRVGSLLLGAAGICFTIANPIIGSAVLSGAVAMGSHAFSNPVDYSHSECKTDTFKGALTGALGGIAGPLISKVPLVGKIADLVASKLPIGANTVTNMIVVGSVSGTSSTVNAIKDFLEGKEAKFSRVALSILTSLATAGVGGGLYHFLEVPNPDDAGRLFIKSFSGAFGGAAGQAVGNLTSQTMENYKKGKPLLNDVTKDSVLKDVVKSAVISGTLSWVNEAIEQDSKALEARTKASSSANAKVPEENLIKDVIPKPSTPSVGKQIRGEADQLKNELYAKAEAQFGHTIRRYIGKEGRSVKIGNEWHKAPHQSEIETHVKDYLWRIVKGEALPFRKGKEGRCTTLQLSQESFPLDSMNTLLDSAGQTLIWNKQREPSLVNSDMKNLIDSKYGNFVDGLIQKGWTNSEISNLNRENFLMLLCDKKIVVMHNDGYFLRVKLVVGGDLDFQFQCRSGNNLSLNVAMGDVLQILDNRALLIENHENVLAQEALASPSSSGLPGLTLSDAPHAEIAQPSTIHLLSLMVTSQPKGSPMPVNHTLPSRFLMPPVEPEVINPILVNERVQQDPVDNGPIHGPSLLLAPTFNNEGQRVDENLPQSPKNISLPPIPFRRLQQMSIQMNREREDETDTKKQLPYGPVKQNTYTITKQFDGGLPPIPFDKLQLK